jgi:hypothetical protein
LAPNFFKKKLPKDLEVSKKVPNFASQLRETPTLTEVSRGSVDKKMRK